MDRFAETFLNFVFDESWDGEKQMEADVIDVEPVSYSSERSEEKGEGKCQDPIST